MPHEVLGVDLTQPEGREAYLEVFSYFDGKKVDTPDELHFAIEVIDEWKDKNLEEAKEFIIHCSNHSDPLVRKEAAYACSRFIAVDPEFTIDSIEKLLADEDPIVRSIASYYQDILNGGDALENFFAYSGILGVHRLIKAVETANRSLETSRIDT